MIQCIKVRSGHLLIETAWLLYNLVVLSHAPVGIIGIDAVAIIRWPRAKNPSPASAKGMRWRGGGVLCLWPSNNSNCVNAKYLHKCVT